jgi:hypothetical protein
MPTCMRELLCCVVCWTAAGLVQQHAAWRLCWQQQYSMAHSTTLHLRSCFHVLRGKQYPGDRRECVIAEGCQNVQLHSSMEGQYNVVAAEQRYVSPYTKVATQRDDLREHTAEMSISKVLLTFSTTLLACTSSFAP